MFQNYEINSFCIICLCCVWINVHESLYTSYTRIYLFSTIFTLMLSLFCPYYWNKGSYRLIFFSLSSSFAVMKNLCTKIILILVFDLLIYLIDEGLTLDIWFSGYYWSDLCKCIQFGIFNLEVLKIKYDCLFPLKPICLSVFPSVRPSVCHKNIIQNVLPQGSSVKMSNKILFYWHKN